MEFAGIALIPLVIGLSEVLKKIGFNQKFIPVVNLIFGLAVGIVFINPGDIKAGIIQGLFIGLSASGLYSGVKNIAEEIKG
jgi:uncharacterized membrane protein YfbV (UPF0208 family)